MLSKSKFLEALDLIAALFPDAHGELNWDTPFHLLVAVSLSAQTTDVGVNKATPALFARYPEPEDLAQADLTEVESYIKTIGLYKTKAKHIVAASQMLVARYGGEVPQDKGELVKLPGVGVKTANVVAAEAFGVPGIAVDTHVDRVTKRLGLVAWNKTVGDVEAKLMRTIPKNRWIKAHHQLIFFGRYHCTAKKPKCADCPVFDICQWDGKYEAV
ncbi:MAG: endonuclease III [Streptococcaceae bacterium]|jgi:endonuclease-3|nr:endonuclease III [Streptococcaceae bacterium]